MSAHIKRRIAEEYDQISWILRILFGGAINITFLDTFLGFISPYVFLQNKQLYYYTNIPIFSFEFWILLILVFVSPILLSMMLTKREPKLHIVPPFWISTVTVFYVLVRWYFPITATTFVSLGIIAVLAVLSRAEDSLITYVLGIATDRESIFFEHLLVFANIEAVKERLSVPEMRTELALSPRIQGDSETGYIFRTARGFDFVDRFLITKSKDYPEEGTDVKIAHYAMGRYNLKMSPVFYQHTRKTSVYIRDILRSREPKLSFQVITELTSNAEDPLVDSIIDDLMGAYMKSKRFSGLDKLKIGATVGVFIASAILIVLGYPLYGGFSALLDALYALTELPDIVSRQRTR